MFDASNQQNIFINQNNKPNEIYKQVLITSLKKFPFKECKFKKPKYVSKTKYYQATIEQYFKSS